MAEAGAFCNQRLFDFLEMKTSQNNYQISDFKENSYSNFKFELETLESLCNVEESVRTSKCNASLNDRTTTPFLFSPYRCKPWDLKPKKEIDYEYINQELDRLINHLKEKIETIRKESNSL